MSNFALDLLTHRKITVRSKSTVAREFEIHSKVGKGGLANVYLAKNDEEEIAIKLIQLTGSISAQELATFNNECAILSDIPHSPFIVRYLGQIDPFEIHGSMYAGFAMEYLKNGSLNKNLPLPNYLDFVASSCSGLDFLHNLEFVHSDVKPQNILISDSDVAKLCDFGLTTRIGQIILPNKIVGAIAGTGLYLAPERIFQDAPASIQMDIYSIGITILRAFESSLWRNMRSSIGNQAEFHVIPDKVTLLTEFFPFFPPSLIQIVRTCLYADPKLRYSNASDLAQAIRSVRNTLVYVPTSDSDPSDPTSIPNHSSLPCSQQSLTFPPSASYK